MGDREGNRDTHYGISPCIAGVPQIKEGSTLNNCVGAAWGLFAKAENNPKCKVGFISNNIYPNGAGSWWNDGKQSNYDFYERGKEAKVGSVICWKTHVAYVNEVKENGDIEVIESWYKHEKPIGFEIATLSKASGYQAWKGSGECLGFIYPKKIVYTRGA